MQSKESAAEADYKLKERKQLIVCSCKRVY